MTESSTLLAAPRVWDDDQVRHSLVLAGSIAVAMCGCDMIFGLHGFTRDGGSSIDAPVDSAFDAAPLGPPSCKQILADDPSAASGMFEIDPDGGGGEGLLPVNCDMTTAGGGWTLVFIAPTVNVQTPPSYTSQSAALLTAAQEAMIVFRDGTLAPLTGAATFPMPPEWRAKSPFEYSGNDFATTVSIDGAAAVSATVRYGQQTFTQHCTDAWQPGTMWGRVCITGTTAPFYTGWYRDVIDSCVDSTAVFSTAACSTAKVFTIAVR